MKSIDAKGLNCPKPVLETKKYIDANPDITEIEVIVDNNPAVENVSRFLSNQGFETDVDSDENEHRIKAQRHGGKEVFSDSDEAPDGEESDELKTLVMITNNKMGLGDDILGKKLMQSFISTLDEYSGLWKLVFVNAGVKLAVKGSETVDALKKLESSGIKILVCGTCLDHYNLLNEKQVGETTNMLDIVTSLNLAEKIIQL
ncbi:MAG: sulfurtransferase-like selenium metabolism protein YedF [Thermodesulfobacteriota bacterium]